MPDMYPDAAGRIARGEAQRLWLGYSSLLVMMLQNFFARLLGFP